MITSRKWKKSAQTVKKTKKEKHKRASSKIKMMKKKEK